MALTRDQKKAQVADLTKKMQNASSVIFAQYLGLTVSNITKLRSNLKKEKAEMQVAKKTLIQIAAKDAKLPDIADAALPGGVACIFSTTEPTSGAAVAFRFAKDHPQVKLVGGIFDGKFLTAAETNALATIPSRLQLLGIFLAMCSAPLVQFASACSSPLTGFARALSEIAKKKEAAAPAAAPPPIAEASVSPATPAAPATATAA
jgi:large subunit ribosomal protein L10